MLKRSGKERYSDGNVPSVNWNGNYSKLNVNRYDPGNANDNFRSRQKFRQHRRSTSGGKVFYPPVCHFRYFLQIYFQFNILVLLDDI